VNDDGSGEDLPIIDVRSPAERLTDSGRDSLGRLQERLRGSPLDIAALIWMICVIGLLATEIYSAFAAQLDGFGESTAWFKAALLASSGGFSLAAGCMIGVGLAAWVHSRQAQVALLLAVIGGAWSTVAGLIGVAVIYNDDVGGPLVLGNYADNRVVVSLGQLFQGGLGIVVVLVAASMLASRRPARSGDPEIADLT